MITCIYGTRPEAIKLGPVAAELHALGVEFTVLCTGQHSELLIGTPAESDLASGKSLGLLSNNNVLSWTHAAEARLRSELGSQRPALVVVQGDTMSAVAGARAASALKLPLAHVEAGVRSHSLDEPWPEEAFRVEIAQLARWHYAPTSTAFANLVQEKIAPERILVTGNSGVSAIARYTRAQPVAEAVTPVILVTLHRREFLQGPHVEEVILALCRAADHSALTFTWPMHPALARSVKISAPPNLRIIAPLSYAQCVDGLALCVGVLTDSGGLIEEAATLGVPSVQLRNVSDRPEAIEAGVSMLCPPTAEGVASAVRALTSRAIPRRATAIFGTAEAASAIARHLASVGKTS